VIGYPSVTWVQQPIHLRGGCPPSLLALAHHRVWHDPPFVHVLPNLRRRQRPDNLTHRLVEPRGCHACLSTVAQKSRWAVVLFLFRCGPRWATWPFDVGRCRPSSEEGGAARPPEYCQTGLSSDRDSPGPEQDRSSQKRQPFAEKGPTARADLKTADSRRSQASRCKASRHIPVPSPVGESWVHWFSLSFARPSGGSIERGFSGDSPSRQSWLAPELPAHRSSAGHTS
jgi:hypothetical protein